MDEYYSNADEVKILKASSEQFPRLSQLWLDTSLSAHSFIDSDYWTANQQAMETQHLPGSEVYVCTENGEIVGFAAMSQNHLAALFVDDFCQGRGYGRLMLDYVKKDRDTVTLNVFVQNAKAAEFYQKNGFKIEREQTDQATNEREYVMVWKQA